MEVKSTTNVVTVDTLSNKLLSDLVNQRRQDWKRTLGII